MLGRVSVWVFVLVLLKLGQHIPPAKKRGNRERSGSGIRVSANTDAVIIP